MVHAQEVEDGGVEVVDAGAVLFGAEADFVGAAVGGAAFGAAAGQPAPRTTTRTGRTIGPTISGCLFACYLAQPFFLTQIENALIMDVSSCSSICSMNR